jgi:hypothetical protein
MLGAGAVAATEKLVRGTRTRRLSLSGAIEYMLHPDRGIAWGGPFNGQRSRQNLFRSLVERFAPAAIVETGTYLGTTTEFLAATELPIYSVESDPRNYGFASARFWRTRNVHLLYGDSRTALQMMFDGPLHWARNRSVFVYLDAHWGHDLPLAEELSIVFGACPNAIVMVDDFQVPFDKGYGFDDYGPCRTLTAELIEPIVAAHSLQVLYPSIPSVEETGARRGCVVISNDSVPLASLPLLRRLGEAIEIGPM